MKYTTFKSNFTQDCWQYLDQEHFLKSKGGHATQSPIQKCLISLFSCLPMSLCLSLSNSFFPFALLLSWQGACLISPHLSKPPVVLFIHEFTAEGSTSPRVGRSVRVAASQWGLLQSLQSPKPAPHRSSKSAVRLRQGLRFQETSLR